MILFAFDRDCTIDSSDDPGPIPLLLVRYLHFKTEHQVGAIGNQILCLEAEIPGIKDVQRELNLSKEEIDRVIGKMKEDRKAILEKQHRNVFSKQTRLYWLEMLHPDILVKIVIDDYFIDREGWVHLFPEFMKFWPIMKVLL